MDRPLRPAPRLDARLLDSQGRAFTYAGASRACSAVGLSLADLLRGSDFREGEATVAEAAASSPLSLLDGPSRARVKRLDAALQEAVTVAVLDRIGAEIGAARREYAEARARLVEAMSPMDRRLFDRWKPAPGGSGFGDGTPLEARLSALGSADADRMLHRWSLARLLSHLCACEVASFYDAREKAGEALFGKVRGLA